MIKPTPQHPGTHKHPEAINAGGTCAGAGQTGPKSTIKPSKCTTHSPADWEIDRAGGIRPGRPHPETSKAGGAG